MEPNFPINYSEKAVASIGILKESFILFSMFSVPL